MFPFESRPDHIQRDIEIHCGIREAGGMLTEDLETPLMPEGAINLDDPDAARAYMEKIRKSPLPSTPKHFVDSSPSC